MAKRVAKNTGDAGGVDLKPKRNGGGAGGADSGNGDGADAGGGSGDGGSGSVIDPRDVIGDGGASGADGEPGAAGAEPRTKRAYRKRGTGKAASGASALDLTNLNRVLLVSHLVLARLSHVPELELDETEAQSLGAALGEVLSHYNVSFLDDKTTAWINLAQVSFGVYGTRFAAARVRMNAEREEAGERAAAEKARIVPAPTAPAFTNVSTFGGGQG